MIETLVKQRYPFSSTPDKLPELFRNVNDKNQETATKLKNLAISKRLKIEVLEMDVTSEASVESAMTKIPTSTIVL